MTLLRLVPPMLKRTSHKVAEVEDWLNLAFLIEVSNIEITK